MVNFLYTSNLIGMETSFEFSDNVLGIILEDKMDNDYLKQIHSRLREKFEKNHLISVYLEDRNTNGITLQAVVKDLAFEMNHKRSLQKIAIVSDSKFFKFVAELKEKLIDVHVESFDKEERMKAMNWVMQ